MLCDQSLLLYICPNPIEELSRNYKSKQISILLERGEELFRQIAFLSMFLVLLLASVSYRPPVGAASSPQLILDPTSIVNEALTPGNTITLTAKVLDITDLYAYEFKIYYNSTLLNATSAVRPVGHFLEPSDPGSQFIPKWELKNSL